MLHCDRTCKSKRTWQNTSWRASIFASKPCVHTSSWVIQLQASDIHVNVKEKKKASQANPAGVEFEIIQRKKMFIHLFVCVRVCVCVTEKARKRKERERENEHASICEIEISTAQAKNLSVQKKTTKHYYGSQFLFLKNGTYYCRHRDQRKTCFCIICCFTGSYGRHRKVKSHSKTT